MAQTQPMTIQIMQGTYAMPPAWEVGTDVKGGTDYLGGYLNNCTGYQYGAANTVIQSNNAIAPSMNVKGSIVLADLTISLPAPLELYVDDYLEDLDQFIYITVERSTISGLYVSFDAPFTSVGGDVTIQDTLIVHANSDCALKFNMYGTMVPIHLINNTVANNTRDPGLTTGVCFFDTHFSGVDGYSTLIAYNNIFYGNTSSDFYADNSNLSLFANIIGVPAYPTPQQEFGTLNGDPLLDPVTFRPSKVPLSIAINSGNKNPPGGIDSGDSDNAGNPRLVGSKPDRGAFESNIDDSTAQLVSNADDHGTGSLRQAIINANSTAGSNVITFDIGTGCTQVIHLESDLPDIKGDLRINGYSQVGSKVNNLDVGLNAQVCIVLSGYLHTVHNGLHVAPGANGASLAVSGIAFEYFDTAAINLEGGSGHTVAGNKIGGVMNGLPLGAVQAGVTLGAGVSGSFVGTLQNSGRNLLSGTSSSGVVVAAGAHDNEIRNNYVGVGWNGDYVDHGNATKGIVVSGDNNHLDHNLVGFSGNDGIDLDGSSAHDNIVENNAIGSDDGSGANLGNGSMGVRVENGGHDNTIRQNTIAQNAGTGVRIVSGLGNTIRHNGIRDNGSFGIDLGAGGVDLIDNDDAIGAQLLANRGLNYPVIGVATGTAHKGVVTGGLTTTGGDYIIDVYSSPPCDGSSHGEGARWLGSQVITRASAGGLPTPFRVTFVLPAPASIAFGAAITATATDAAGNLFPGNTSEFSACMNYTNDVIFANGFNP